MPVLATTRHHTPFSSLLALLPGAGIQVNMSAEIPPGTFVPGSAPHQAHPHSHPDSAAIKLTRGTSCVLCQQRKVRCDKNKPCANCVKARVECRVIAPQPPRRRKKRLQERDLIDRLKRYETLLSEHGVKFDAIGPDLRSDNQHGDDVDELENDFEGLKTTPEASVSPSAASQSEKCVLLTILSLDLTNATRI